MLTILAAAALQGGTAQPLNGVQLPPSTTQFDFIALGDNRPAAAGLPATPIFKSILEDVANIGPAFVISSGDVVFGKDESLTLYNKELDEITSLIRKLPCPFFNAPGNHEISERPEYYAEYTKRFGPTYASFEFGGWKFLQVSTEEVGFSPNVAPVEIAWLKQAVSGQEPKIAFHHHPIHTRKTNAEVGAGVGNHDEVEAIFKSGNVKYDFQGHDHVFNHQTHEGIEYYISGGAGAPLDAPPEDGGYFHFMVVHVDGEKVEIDPIPAGAIQVTPTSDGEIVGNYSDFPLHFHHLKLFAKSAPANIAATLLTKKGKKPVAVEIVAKDQLTDGVDLYLDVTTPAHTAVRITE